MNLRECIEASLEGFSLLSTWGETDTESSFLCEDDMGTIHLGIIRTSPRENVDHSIVILGVEDLSDEQIEQIKGQPLTVQTITQHADHECLTILDFSKIDGQEEWNIEPSLIHAQTARCWFQ